MAPGGSRDIGFYVDFGTYRPRVTGSFHASGGANDIEVFIVNDEDYDSWNIGRAIKPVYNSGATTSADINVMLPTTGHFYLVINNTYSSAHQAAKGDDRLARPKPRSRELERDGIRRDGDRASRNVLRPRRPPRLARRAEKSRHEDPLGALRLGQFQPQARQSQWRRTSPTCRRPSKPRSRRPADQRRRYLAQNRTGAEQLHLCGRALYGAGQIQPLDNALLGTLPAWRDGDSFRSSP